MIPNNFVPSAFWPIFSDFKDLFFDESEICFYTPIVFFFGWIILMKDALFDGRWAVHDHTSPTPHTQLTTLHVQGV